MLLHRNYNDNDNEKESFIREYVTKLDEIINSNKSENECDDIDENQIVENVIKYIYFLLFNLKIINNTFQVDDNSNDIQIYSDTIEHMIKMFEFIIPIYDLFYPSNTEFMDGLDMLYKFDLIEFKKLVENVDLENTFSDDCKMTLQLDTFLVSFTDTIYYNNNRKYGSTIIYNYNQMDFINDVIEEFVSKIKGLENQIMICEFFSKLKFKENDFFGRQSYMRILDEQMHKKGDGFVYCIGIPKVGKTRVLKRFSEIHANRYKEIINLDAATLHSNLDVDWYDKFLQKNNILIIVDNIIKHDDVLRKLASLSSIEHGRHIIYALNKCDLPFDIIKKSGAYLVPFCNLEIESIFISKCNVKVSCEDNKSLEKYLSMPEQLHEMINRINNQINNQKYPVMIMKNGELNFL